MHGLQRTEVGTYPEEEEINLTVGLHYSKCQ